MKHWAHLIKAVIFDNDGVVIDSLQIYRDSIREVIGLDFPAELVTLIKGRSDADVCRISVEYLKLPMTVEQFAQKRHDILMKRLPNSTLIPGAETIVRRMKEMGLPIALATSGNRAGQIAKATNHKELYCLFDVIVCGDEVKEAKPSPEIFQVAAEKLGDFKPENILVIDDAANGIIAANRAKMLSVMLSAKGPVEGDDPLATPFVRFDSFDSFDFSLFDFEP